MLPAFFPVTLLGLLFVLLSTGLLWPRFRAWRAAEGRAEALLRKLLSAEEYRQLGQLGYLEVRSRAQPGRRYRIPRHWGLVQILEGGTEHDQGRGHGAYSAAVRRIADLIGQAPDLFRRHVEGHIYPTNPAAGEWEVRVVIVGVDQTGRQPMGRQWHYHPQVQGSTQQIVCVNLYDGPHRPPKRHGVYQRAP